MFNARTLLISTAIGCLFAAGTTLPARADVSIEGGAFVTKGTTAPGAALSLGVFKAPVIPLAAEITAAAPLDGKGYAATADLRFSPFGTTIGGGIGLGTVGSNTTAVLYDVILGKSIAPHVGLEGRMYLGPNRTSSAFAGVRLSF